MKIFNLHSSDEKTVENLKVIDHEEYDKNGQLQVNTYVEYTVIGKNRKWTDFMPINDFKKLNPKVKIK